MLQEAAAELAMLVEPVFSSKHEPVVLQLCDVLVKLYTAYPVQNGQDQNARVSRDLLVGDALSWQAQVQGLTSVASVGGVMQAKCDSTLVVCMGQPTRLSTVLKVGLVWRPPVVL